MYPSIPPAPPSARCGDLPGEDKLPVGRRRRWWDAGPREQTRRIADWEQGRLSAPIERQRSNLQAIKHPPPSYQESPTCSKHAHPYIPQPSLTHVGNTHVNHIGEQSVAHHIWGQEATRSRAGRRWNSKAAETTRARTAEEAGRLRSVMRQGGPKTRTISLAPGRS